MPLALESDADVGLVPLETDADVGLVKLESDADVGLAPPLHLSELSGELPASIRQKGVNLPSMFSSGLPPGTPPGQNPDYDFTAALETARQEGIKKAGRGLQTAGEVASAGASDIFNQLSGRAIREREIAAEHPGLAQPTNLRALLAGEKPPSEVEAEALPPALRAIDAGRRGLIKSAPQLAAVAAGEAVGIPPWISGGLVFGTTPEGYDIEQGTIGAVLPKVSELTGELSAYISQKFGVSSKLALAAIAKTSAATGSAGLLTADQAAHIYQLPPEQRKDAWIEATGNAAGLLGLSLIGGHGEKPVEEKLPPAPELSPDSLAGLQASMQGNQIRPAVEAQPAQPKPTTIHPDSMAGILARARGEPLERETQAEPAAEVAPETPTTPAAVPARNKVHAQILEMLGQAPEEEAPVPESQAEVLPPVPDFIHVETPAGIRRVTVSAKMEKGRARLTAVKLHDDATGAYDQFPLPEGKTFPTLDEAANAGFDLVRSRFPEVPAPESKRPVAPVEAKPPEVPPAPTKSGAVIPGQDDSRQGVRIGTSDTAGNVPEELLPVKPGQKAEPVELGLARGKLNSAQSRLDSLTLEGKGQSTFAFRLRAKIGRQKRIIARLESGKAPRKKGLFSASNRLQAEENMNGPDIISWIIDTTKMLSKSAAKKNWSPEKFAQNKSLWDDAVLLQRPHHNKIYSESGRGPDRVAQDAYREGLIDEPQVSKLWEAIDAASKSRANAYKQLRKQEERIKADIAEEQARNKPPIPENASLGGETKGPALTLTGDEGGAEAQLRAENEALRRRLEELQRPPEERQAEEQPPDEEPPPEQGAPEEPPDELKEGGQELFGKPESVEQQRERQKRERQANAEALAKRTAAERLAAGQKRRLTGGPEDTTSGEMFGPETRQDKSGQGSFFETPSDREELETRKLDLDSRAWDLFRKNYNELDEPQKSAARAKVAADDLVRNNISAHPVDKKSGDAVASLYGVAPEEIRAAAQARVSYAQGELDFTKPAAVPPGQPTGNDVVAGRLPAGARVDVAGVAGRTSVVRALTELTSKALSRAFRHNTVISSLDPAAVPKEIPQYRVIGTLIRTSGDFVKTLLSLRSPYSESLKIAILDDENRVVHSQTLYSGTLDTTVLDGRDFLRLAHEFKAQGKRVLMSHNHPSGQVPPSDADKNFTQRIRGLLDRAGFELVDHVITNGQHYYSFADEAVHPIENPTLQPWEILPRESLRLTDTNTKLEPIIEQLRQSNPKVAHIIYLNTRLHVTAIERVAPAQKAIKDALFAGIGREGAMRVILDFGPSLYENTAYSIVRDLKDQLRGTQTEISDFACNGILSAKSTGMFGAALSETAPGAKISEEAAAEKTEPPDKVLNFLDSLKIGKEGGAGGGTGNLGTFGLVPETWNTLVDLVKLGVKGGRSLAAAVDWAVDQLRADHPDEAKNLDEDAARRHFLSRLRAPAIEEHGRIEARRDEISNRLNFIGAEAARLAKTGEGLPDDLKSERYALTKEDREAARKLYTNESYVAELLRRQDQLGRELKIARDAGNGARARDIAEKMLGTMQGEFSLIKPDVLKRVYDELVSTGQIMADQTTELRAGRTLGDLTSWLRANNVESPKLTIAERLGVGQKAADAWNKTKDLASQGWAKTRAVWDTIRDQWRTPRTDTDFRSLMKDWFAEKSYTGIETHRWVREIRAQIPRRIRREALSVWLDAQGDARLLEAQRDLVPPRFRPIWDTALKLTPKEQALARQISIDFEQKLSDAQNMGLVEKGRADYGVPQLWKIPPLKSGAYDPFAPKADLRTARNVQARLDPRAPFFSLQRTNPSYFDGIMHNGVPRSLDAGDLVGVYNADMHGSLADRAVIKAMKDAQAADGKPIVMISGNARIAPRGEGERSYFVDSNWKPTEAVTADGRPYRTVDHWALRDWKFASQDEEGNPILVRGDFMVHPDHYRFLKNELGKSWLRDPEGGGKYFNPVLESTAFLKASKFASATFHMATLAEHSMFHAFAGEPSRARASLLWPSTRGIELNPERNPRLARLIRSGMELGFSGPRELFEEGLASHGGIWGLVPGLGDAMNAASDFLFKRYMPALKTKTASVILDANLKRYAGKLTDEQIYEKTADQVNAAFGAQNWRLLGTNKTMLDVNRLLLTAPDFLLSRAKVVGQALKPYHAEQRYFLLAQAALVYTAARVLNQLLDGDPHFEASNALRVVHNGRAYSARFIVQDIAQMIQDPAGFMAGRFGPLLRGGIEAATGRDMRTGGRKEVPIETSSPAFRSAQILLKDAAEWLVPVGAEGIVPGAAGREQTPGGQAALALGGVGSRKFTAETQMYDAARRFNASSPDPAARAYQKQRDDEARLSSQYRKLSDLLEAGELPRAAREFNALVAEGHSPRTIAAHFAVASKRPTEGRPNVARPFSGSVARESDFVKSLSEGQRKIYQNAIAERQARGEAFEKMLDSQAVEK